MNESSATRYQRLRRTAQVVRLSVGAAWLSVVVFTPLGRWTAAWTAEVVPGAPFLLFAAVLVLVWEAVALPAGLYAAIRGERRFRRTRTPLRTVAADHARDALTGTLLAVGAAAVVWTGLTTLGSRWWIAVGLLGAPVLLVATAVAGLTVRTPGASRPLTRQALADRLSALAEQACGTRVAVREWTDPAVTGATAVVTGVGASGAILLSRELAADWSEDEVAVVVAHELSHHARHDLWWKAGLDALVLMAALGVAQTVTVRFGPGLGVPQPVDLAALPLIGLSAWGTWWTLRPLRLAQSRAQERAADRFAIALTGQPEAFRTAVRRLAAQHLAEERPSALTRWFFHKHPTLDERLALASRPSRM